MLLSCSSPLATNLPLTFSNAPSARNFSLRKKVDGMTAFLSLSVSCAHLLGVQTFLSSICRSSLDTAGIVTSAPSFFVACLTDMVRAISLLCHFRLKSISHISRFANLSSVGVAKPVLLAIFSLSLPSTSTIPRAGVRMTLPGPIPGTAIHSLCLSGGHCVMSGDSAEP